jgi:hypothetical protein
VTRISSRFTTFHKRIFPAIPLVAAAAIFLGELFKHGLTGNTLIGPFFMGLVNLGIGFRVWDLVDEVYDCYDHLLVKNHGLEEAIPLSNDRLLARHRVLFESVQQELLRGRAHRPGRPLQVETCGLQDMNETPENQMAPVLLIYR